MPIVQNIDSILPSFPTYTILFLPQMPLRFPPPAIPALSFSTLQASMSVALRLLPENALGVAVSVLAVAVGLGAAGNRYRVKRIRNSNKGSMNVKSCANTSKEEKTQRIECTDERTLDGNQVDFHPTQIPIVNPHHPLQLMTPPLTPPRPVRPIRTPSPTPQEPPRRPSSDSPSASATSTTFASFAIVCAQNNTESLHAPSTTVSGSPAATDRGTVFTSVPPTHAQPTSTNPLPPNLVYTNTSYATLLHAQKLITYERNRRATLEFEARSELGSLLTVYWSGVKARGWDRRRREGRRETFGVGSGGEGGMGAEDEDEGMEKKAESDTKESIRVLQRRVMALREERVPYEDVLYNSSPPAAYRFENGKLTTLPSTRISPSHLVTILADPQVALNVEEVDVALELWADWEWEVEGEWGLEVEARGQDGGDNTIGFWDPEVSSSSARKLPKPRKLTVWTPDVPLGLLFERLGLGPGSLEKICICVEDNGEATNASGALPSTAPSLTTPIPSRARFRSRDSRDERRKRELRRRVGRCLEGLDELSQHLTVDLEMALPDGVEDVWAKTGKED